MCGVFKDCFPKQKQVRAELVSVLLDVSRRGCMSRMDYIENSEVDTVPKHDTLNGLEG